MANKEIEETQAENPEDLSGELKIKEPYKVAAGVEAVFQSDIGVI